MTRADLLEEITNHISKKFPSSKVEFKNYPNADSYYMHVEGKITSIGVESKFLDDIVEVSHKDPHGVKTELPHIINSLISFRLSI